jgi:hypothetical protein
MATTKIEALDEFPINIDGVSVDELRLEGKIPQAMTYEQGAQFAYDGLPESAKW